MVSLVNQTASLKSSTGKLWRMTDRKDTFVVKRQPANVFEILEHKQWHKVFYQGKKVDVEAEQLFLLSKTFKLLCFCWPQSFHIKGKYQSMVSRFGELN